MLGAKPFNHDFHPADYEIFAGLDVDKHSMSVTFAAPEGVLRSMRMPAQPEPLLGYVRRHLPDKRIAFVYEAGPTGFHLHDQIIEAGYPCLVVAPSMVPTAPGQRVKTNRLDSQKLATSLQGGQLRSIFIPSPVYRSLRHLVRLRDTFVRQIAATKCRIKALLLLENLAFPHHSGGWSASVLQQLDALPCAPAIRFKLDRLLESLTFAQDQTLQTTREIHRFCLQDPELNRCLGYLTSIPGIGVITATHLLARIGDWRHLRNVRQLAAFLGVVASERSTGDSIRRGGITHVGDSRLRGKLVQAAWAAIRQDAELREFYQRIYQRNPRDHAAGKAVVAVVRKLTTRIYAVLKEQRPYRIHRRLTREEIRPRERLDCLQNSESASL